MKYRDLQIQTQREAPNNARTEGFAFLVRAGYLTRENAPTKLGEYAIRHLHEVAGEALLSMPTVGNDHETFIAITAGEVEIAHCPSCKYTERLELAQFAKPAAAAGEPPLPMEKVSTPDCNTIESLANFLGIPKEKTAKAMMYTRPSDGQFIFVVIRGDMQLSDAKLRAQVGDIRTATADEIVSAGAVPGYASAIGLARTTEGSVEGLKDALIVVDDLILHSPNLVAGANEAGYHLKNTNHGRDYSAEIAADLIQVQQGDACARCGGPLSVRSAIGLKQGGEYNLKNILLALAETHHDDKGLILPHPSAPFDVHLMHLPGREMDTLARAGEIYDVLTDAGISVLFDDREERAGVKFNDADLIGLPIRVTVGEKGLKEGMVELKQRTGKVNQPVAIEKITEEINLF